MGIGGISDSQGVGAGIISLGLGILTFLGSSTYGYGAIGGLVREQVEHTKYL